MSDYTCDHCGGIFEAGRTEKDANAEAEKLFGVANASEDPDMACICDDCWQAMTPFLRDEGIDV